MNTEDIYKKSRAELLTYLKDSPDVKNKIVGYSSMKVNDLRDAVNNIVVKKVDRVGERKKSAYSMAIKDLYAEVKPKGFLNLSEHKDRLNELKANHAGGNFTKESNNSIQKILVVMPKAEADVVKIVEAKDQMPPPVVVDLSKQKRQRKPKQVN
jgi:hypothetical protein